MTRSDGLEREIWGTWEELLLASAVSRHGTQSWDSVAMEVQSRSPFPHLLTAQTCEQRYNDLQRRFVTEDREIDVEDAREGAQSNPIPWFEELRKLRVAELRREVQRYDVSIVSLQLKVERLKEERERSLQEEESGDRRLDLANTEEVRKDAKPPSSSPENFAVDRIAGRDSGRSCNQSNSTEPKDGQDPDGAEDRKLELVTGNMGNDVKKPDPVTSGDEKVAGEGSYNGSSNTVSKGVEAATPAEGPAMTDPVRQPDVGESGESMAESKGEAPKESSDVQSSASLSRRRRSRRKVASGGSSGGDGVEADDVSPVSKGNVAKSQPLMAFLEIIRSHKYGSIFERRIESQESAQYRSLIRQHMDLEMVRNKLEEGAYTSVEFCRDLMLLCANAIVFFPRNSPESVAAVQIRELVVKQIATTIQKPALSSPSAVEEPAAQPRPPPAAQQPPAPKAQTDPDLASSLQEKPNSTPPLIACRKRSSISTKTAAEAVAAKEEEEKLNMDKEELESVEKKRTRERSAVSGVRGLRTSKGRGSSGGNARGVMKTSPSTPISNPTENAAQTAKTERKNNSGSNATAAVAPTGSPVSVAKKRSAANFLARMKRGSSSSNGALLETLKSGGRGGGSGEQKKGVRGDGRKDHGYRQGSGAAAVRKQTQEQTAPVKRSVGRPPKRQPPLTPPLPAKRAREVETGITPPRPRAAAARKRGRR